MFNFVLAAEDSQSLVTCAVGTANTPCTISDLFSTLNNFSAYLLYTIFPFAFFFALMYAFLPVLKDPSNPANLNHLKKSLSMIAIGTFFVIGSYFLVRILLSSLGVTNSAVNNAIEEPQKSSSLPFTIAYAESFVDCDGDGVNDGSSPLKICNPIKSQFVEEILSIMLNFGFFLVVIGLIYGYIRGALYLVTSQQIPEGIKKGKQWIIWTTIVGVVLFSAPTILGIIIDTVDSLKPKTRATVEVGCIDSSVVGGCAAAGLKSSE